VRDENGVREKFGVPPAQIADFLALVGDTSDNIPGINGVGPKTAAKWLSEWGNLEDVIAHAAELQPERFRAVVAAEADKLRLNLKLTTLNLDLPSLVLSRPTPVPGEIYRLLEELEMRSALIEARQRYDQPELF
jgi:DNA polymerase-1